MHPTYVWSDTVHFCTVIRNNNYASTRCNLYIIYLFTHILISLPNQVSLHTFGLCIIKFHVLIPVRPQEQNRHKSLTHLRLIPWSRFTNEFCRKCARWFCSVLLCSTKSVNLEGRPVMSDATHLSGISGLPFDSSFLSPFFFLPSSSVAFSVWSFCCKWSIILTFLLKTWNTFC